ncbi:MAG: hypothetical protein IKI50_00935 [Clostridia bacterium]|nr:hypothetical protein [Clostridia bacterium]
MKKRIVAMAAALLLCGAQAFCAQAQMRQAGRVHTPPMLDGVLAPDEWGTPLLTLYPDSGEAYLERSDPSVEWPQQMCAYMMWDDGALYAAVTVTGAVHRNTQTQPGTCWDGDAVLLSLQGEGGCNRLCCAWGQDGTVLCGAFDRAQDGQSIAGASAAHTAAVTRQGNVTTYEMRIDPAALTYPIPALQADGELALQWTLYLSEAGGRCGGMMLYTPDGQAPAQTPLLLALTGEPANPSFVITTAAPPTTTTQPTAPTTAPAAAAGWMTEQTAGWLSIGLAVAGAALLIAVLVLWLRQKK